MFAAGTGHAGSDDVTVKQEEEGPKPFLYDLVNVSEGFLLRTAYKKKVSPAKLDELLEHRVKQQVIEERQKKSAICANPKVVIQRLKFKMEPHGAVACIQPEVKSEAKKGITGVQDSTKEPVLSFSQEAGTIGSTGECVGQVEPGGGGTAPGLSQTQSGIQKTTPPFSGDPHKQCVNMDNKSRTVLPSTGGSSVQKFISTVNQQTSVSTPAQVNNVTSLGENGDGYKEQESKGNSPLFLQMNGQDVKEPGTGDTMTKMNDRRIEDDKKALSLKDPLKPVVNGSTVLGGDATGVNPEYLPPQKVPRLGVTVEDLALSSPTIPKSEPALNSKEHNIMEARLDGDDKESQRTIVPSPVLSAEESSLSNDFVESSCSRGSHTTSVVTQVTTTVTTTTESHAISSGTVTESNTVSTLTNTTKTTVTQETKTTTAPSSTESSSLTVSKAITRVQSTRERVQLIRFSRTKKARSETALPSYRTFTTKSCKKSIFILPTEELKKLARKGGFREVSVFNYNAKPASDIWPYPSPRPTFGVTWR